MTFCVAGGNPGDDDVWHHRFRLWNSAKGAPGDALKAWVALAGDSDAETKSAVVSGTVE